MCVLPQMWILTCSLILSMYPIVREEKCKKNVFNLWTSDLRPVNSSYPIPVRKLNTCYCVNQIGLFPSKQSCINFRWQSLHFPDGDFHISLLPPPHFPDYSPTQEQNFHFETSNSNYTKTLYYPAALRPCHDKCKRHRPDITRQ